MIDLIYIYIVLIDTIVTKRYTINIVMNQFLSLSARLGSVIPFFLREKHIKDLFHDGYFMPEIAFITQNSKEILKPIVSTCFLIK